jgi:phosphoglycerate dehydrogenase-like enzyme
MSSLHVLFTKVVADRLLQPLYSVSPGLNVHQIQARSVHDVPDYLWQQAEILYTHGLVPDPAQAPYLKWVHLHGAGADKISETPLWQSDILLTNGSGIHAPAMGEYVLMMMMAFAHRLPQMIAFQRRHEWGGPVLRSTMTPKELRRDTVGIIGYGSLGQEMGRLAHAVGMRVIGVNRSGSLQTEGYVVPELAQLPGTAPDALYSIDHLYVVLPQCDYVVLVVPSTPATHHLIGMSELKLMKSDAVLVNVARGTVVDEKALIRALDEGWIGGAALDVFETEPLPSESPLWRMHNVLISPHLSGWNPRYDERSVELFTTNLRRYLAGDPLINQVLRNRGY